ncbi:CAP domain-containing protein [Mycena sp. CBHHK59/15]|nr:CAP domain-containing protein [Mycena sp. CBHHK59/15]
MARLLSATVVLSLVSSGLAGPACAQKHWQASDCILACNTKWGFPGLMMSTDRWGTVMHHGGSTDDTWNKYIANACGQVDSAADSSAAASSTSSSAAAEETKIIHQGLGTQNVSADAATSTQASTRVASSSSTRSTTSTTSTPHTTSTTSTTHTTSTTPTTTSTKAKTTQQVVHTQAAHTTSTKAAATTTAANSNSNSGLSSSSSSGSGASSSNQQAYLSAHNSIRSQHGAVPLTWSDEAASKAQEWANECKNVHSGGTLENLAAGTGDFSIAEAVKAWTDEVSEYDSSNPQPSHFTQVVWKATTQVGCAVAVCDGIFSGFGAANYYVCEYSVQGNVIGNFAANVQA